MKVLFSIIIAASILLITSCSNHNDASFITNPVLGKADVSPSTVDANVFPYPYLNEFSRVNEFKVYSESPNSIKITLESSGPYVAHYYVVVEYYPAPYSDVPLSTMYFIDELVENTMEISGVNEYNIANVFVYAFHTDGSQEISYPFYNGQQFGKIKDYGYDVIKDDIHIKGNLVQDVEKLFLLIYEKENTRLIYLGKPTADEIYLKKFGANGVVDIKLFAQFIYTKRADVSRS